MKYKPPLIARSYFSVSQSLLLSHTIIRNVCVYAVFSKVCTAVQAKKCRMKKIIQRGIFNSLSYFKGSIQRVIWIATQLGWRGKEGRPNYNKEICTKTATWKALLSRLVRYLLSQGRWHHTNDYVILAWKLMKMKVLFPWWEKIKSKGKVLPITGQEGPERSRCTALLFLQPRR